MYCILGKKVTMNLVGGFNPFEKYESNWKYSPIFGVKIPKIFELPPPRNQHWNLDAFTLRRDRFPKNWRVVMITQLCPHGKG